MGCFQSQNHKNKAKPLKMPKLILGEHNIKWKRLAQNSIAARIIIDDINGTAQHPAYKAIDKDVERTFPSEEFFTKQSNIKIFKETLKFFALTFPKVGYTQGLNFLTGYLLLNKMNKFQCINILVSLSIHPSLMFLGLYEDNFPLAELYCELFWKILKKIDTELFDCLKIIGVSDHMWIFQWYLTFFLYSFPLHYISFFFNSILEYKELEVVRISVGIVLCLREDIIGLTQKDEVTLIEYLENLKDLETCMRIFSVEEAVQKAHGIGFKQIQTCLTQIKAEIKVNNFYLDYFLAQKTERKNSYTTFIKDIEDRKVELSNSKHDQRLMQSYKRNRQTVQILDEILLESIKRQMNKKYKSNLVQMRKNHANKNIPLKKWKSLAHLEEEPQKQNEGETTVSIVKKVIIPENQDE